MQAVMCECGCGEPAPITRGKQMRFVQGHNGRLNLSEVRPAPRRGPANNKWLGEAAHHNGVHTWLRKNFPKAGVCDLCGRVGRTDHAFLNHPQAHTRNRNDYRELCRSCHVRFDRGLL